MKLTKIFDFIEHNNDGINEELYYNSEYGTFQVYKNGMEGNFRLPDEENPGIKFETRGKEYYIAVYSTKYHQIADGKIFSAEADTDDLKRAFEDYYRTSEIVDAVVSFIQSRK